MEPKQFGETIHKLRTLHHEGVLTDDELQLALSVVHMADPEASLEAAPAIDAQEFLEHQKAVLRVLKEMGELHRLGILETGELRTSKELFLMALQNTSTALGPDAAPQTSTYVEIERTPSGQRAPAGGWELAPSQRVLGDYRINAAIGYGAMGQVYHATHIGTAMDRALKLVYPHYWVPPDAKESLIEALDAHLRLQHHHIITVDPFTPSSREEIFCYTMDYIDGVSLERLLRPHKSLELGKLLPLPVAFELLSQICEAVNYAHGRGTLHLSIKPSNVLLSRDGVVKVADFGLMRGVRLTASNPHIKWKKLAYYTAPEQIRGASSVGPATDVYSLAALAWRMLTGTRSMYQRDKKLLRDLGPELTAVLQRGHASKAQMRYQEVAAFWNDLHEALLPALQEGPVLQAEEALQEILERRVRPLSLGSHTPPGAAKPASIVDSSPLLKVVAALGTIPELVPVLSELELPDEPTLAEVPTLEAQPPPSLLTFSQDIDPLVPEEPAALADAPLYTTPLPAPRAPIPGMPKRIRATPLPRNPNGTPQPRLKKPKK